MGYREARKYLESVRDMRYRVRRAEAKVRMLEERRTSLQAVGYGGDPVQTSPSGEGFTRMSDRYLDQLEATKRLQVEYEDLYSRMLDEIGEVTNRRYRDLLAHRYLDDMEFYMIGRCMGISPGYARNMHRKAVEAFDREVLQAPPA